ncbi:MAG: oxidoreductase [Actinomycetota bacterium]|nr:oxidoreductase [Actinomycetota bacterium]
MAWSAADIPDQSGRIAVVTGASGGLGLETARELARKGAHVIMAARNQDKAETALRAIKARIPDASLEVRALNLASLESIHRFAAELLQDQNTIALLVNNAGVMGTSRSETADGFELQFGTNHLGHFALTALLMPALLRSTAARVVTVTSTGRHFRAPLELGDLYLESNYDPWRAYGRSKMANLQFAVELNRRLEVAGASAMSLVAHPGFSNTDLQAQSVHASGGGASQRFFHVMVGRFGMAPSDGVLPQLRAATDPTAKGGELYTPRWVNFGPPVRRPISGLSKKPEALKNLWDISERETRVTFDISALAQQTRRR